MNENNIFNSNNNNYENRNNNEYQGQQLRPNQQQNNNWNNSSQLSSNQQLNNQILRNNIYQKNASNANYQSFSNETEHQTNTKKATIDRSNKLNVFKIGVPIIIGGLILVLIINFIKPKENQNNNSSNIVDKNNSQVAGAKYESSVMQVDNNFEEINGNIKDIGSEIIITEDNKVYRASIFKFLSKIDVSIDKIIDYSTYGATADVLLKNKDNSYSIYNRSNSKIQATFNANNIIFASSSAGNVYTINDGYLYYTKIENGKLSSDKNRIYLNIASSTFEEKEIYKGKVEFLDIITDGGNIFFRLEDGTIRAFNINLSSLSGVYYLQPSGMGNKYLKGKEPQNIYGVYSLYGIPYYSIKGDNTHLYYTPEATLSISDFKKCRASKTENECYDEKKLTFNLPSQYNVNDIEKVYSMLDEKNILVIMKDGNIYYYKDGTSYTNRDLNDMNKSGHIKKFYVDSSQIYALCDDNYIYEISKYQFTSNS